MDQPAGQTGTTGIITYDVCLKSIDKFRNPTIAIIWILNLFNFGYFLS